MSDPSKFNDLHIQHVYGERPKCFLTGVHQFVDKHHCLGRGGKHSRKIFSSIYNFVPLQREMHKGAYRDHRYMRMLFLEIAKQRVDQSSYIPTDNDAAFLEYAREWEMNSLPEEYN